MPYLVNDFASSGASLDPSSDVTLPRYAAILVTETGDIKIETHDGNELLVPVASAPFTLPWSVRKVIASGTTITNGNIFAVYLA